MAEAAGRVAIVHERFTELAGSEKVVDVLAQLWPHATIHAPIADESVLPPAVRDRGVHTSALQRLYRGGDYGHLLPLLPRAMASMDLGRPDLVVMSHHAFAHRARVPDGAVAISYTHTPARWIWDAGQRRIEGGPARQLALGALAAVERGADRRAAWGPRRILANSPTVAERIRRWWGREAEVVFPPVDVDYFTPDPQVAREGFLLLSGRLVPYKRPEVAVEAATRRRWELVVAGEGRSRRELEAMAGPSVRFLGRVSDEELRDLYRRCRAVLMPGVEDFGIVPVEAQACGAPVVALADGGATSSVIHGRTGILYGVRADEDDARALIRGVDEVRVLRADAADLRAHAEQFGHPVFKQRLAALALEALAA